MPVLDPRLKTTPDQQAGQGLRHGHRPVTAAGASHGEMQALPAGCGILGQEELDKRQEPVKQIVGTAVLKDMSGGSRISTAAGPQVGNVVRIGQETDVEHQRRVGRRPVFEAEGGDQDGEGHTAPEAWSWSSR